MKHTINALAIALYQAGAMPAFEECLDFATRFIGDNPDLFAQVARTSPAQGGRGTPTQGDMTTPLCPNCGEPVTDHMPGCQLKSR
jgi:hypothetical protein